MRTSDSMTENVAYEYYPSGMLKVKKKIDALGTKCIENYNTSGMLDSKEKYILGKLLFKEKYYTSGALNTKTEYYESGYVKTVTQFDHNGNKLTQTEYWPPEDGKQKFIEIYASYLKKKKDIINNEKIKIWAIYIITFAALITSIVLLHIPMLYVAAGISSLFLLKKLWYKIAGLFSRKQQYKTKRTLAYLSLVALTSLAAGLAIRFKAGFTRNMDKLHKVLYSIIFIAAAVMLLHIMFFFKIFGSNSKYRIPGTTELGIQSHGPKPPGCLCWHQKQLDNKILDWLRLDLVAPFSESNSNETKTRDNLNKPDQQNKQKKEVVPFRSGYYLIDWNSKSATIIHSHPAVDSTLKSGKNSEFPFTEIPERFLNEVLLMNWLYSRNAGSI